MSNISGFLFLLICCTVAPHDASTRRFAQVRGGGERRAPSLTDGPDLTNGSCGRGEIWLDVTPAGRIFWMVMCSRQKVVRRQKGQLLQSGSSFAAHAICFRNEDKSSIVFVPMSWCRRPTGLIGRAHGFQPFARFVVRIGDLPTLFVFSTKHLQPSMKRDQSCPLRDSDGFKDRSPHETDGHNLLHRSKVLGRQAKRSPRLPATDTDMYKDDAPIFLY